MDRLNRELAVAGQLLSSNVDYLSLPEKVLQFGEGNFLRGFVDWMIHELNKNQVFNGRIVAVQPTPHGKVVPKLNAQDGLYTVALRGIQNGEVVDTREVVSSISRGINPYADWGKVLDAAADPNIEVVVSNTTESGLKYMQENFYADQSPVSFPAKLTACMFHRFQVCNGNPSMGWFIIPCELVEDNGDVLRDLVLAIAEDWKLPGRFKEWVVDHNFFCNTLVDRIVTGFPRNNPETFQEELGYEDELLTAGEPYHLFVLDGNDGIQEKLPFHKVGLHVHWGDVTPFRELKVKILNGAHTLICPAGFLSGKETVQEVMSDPNFEAFVKKGMYEEILPVLQFADGTKNEFAASVLDRFRNPFNPHHLLDISLNSIAKFKTRLLPTLVQYVEKFADIPAAIAYSLASLIYFYKSVRAEDGQFTGNCIQGEYLIRDNKEVQQFFYDTWNDSENMIVLVDKVLSNETLWDMDLLAIPGLKEAVLSHLEHIANGGIDIAAVL
ncbi:tagaturonate reductase [Fodinisporobacter ferrooxydans]|uniref:Tagaturonate reductase n=1 Tax=Fodinisporobacter ferrooxydans TaxID=2901836 RepID=A0ABY4CIP1_9BACL|nr:tagaturonate reductase [Alicyclobacillaceae bacterium MYW30-H2]